MAGRSNNNNDRTRGGRVANKGRGAASSPKKTSVFPGIELLTRGKDTNLIAWKKRLADLLQSEYGDLGLFVDTGRYFVPDEIDIDQEQLDDDINGFYWEDMKALRVERTKQITGMKKNHTACFATIRSLLSTEVEEAVKKSAAYERAQRERCPMSLLKIAMEVAQSEGTDRNPAIVALEARKRYNDLQQHPFESSTSFHERFVFALEQMESTNARRRPVNEDDEDGEVEVEPYNTPMQTAMDFMNGLNSNYADFVTSILNNSTLGAAAIPDTLEAMFNAANAFVVKVPRQSSAGGAMFAAISGGRGYAGRGRGGGRGRGRSMAPGAADAGGAAGAAGVAAAGAGAAAAGAAVGMSAGAAYEHAPMCWYCEEEGHIQRYCPLRINGYANVIVAAVKSGRLGRDTVILDSGASTSRFDDGHLLVDVRPDNTLPAVTAFGGRVVRAGESGHLPGFIRVGICRGCGVNALSLHELEQRFPVDYEQGVRYVVHSDAGAVEFNKDEFGLYSANFGERQSDRILSATTTVDDNESQQPIPVEDNTENIDAESDGPLPLAGDGSSDDDGPPPLVDDDSSDDGGMPSLVDDESSDEEDYDTAPTATVSRESILAYAARIAAESKQEKAAGSGRVASGEPGNEPWWRIDDDSDDENTGSASGSAGPRMGSHGGSGRSPQRDGESKQSSERRNDNSDTSARKASAGARVAVTVAELRAQYTKRELDEADEAWAFVCRGNLSFEAAVSLATRSSDVHGCSIKRESIVRAFAIHGADRAAIRGSTRRSSPVVTEHPGERTDVARQELHSDVMWVRKQAYLVSVSWPLDLTLVTAMPGEKTEHLCAAMAGHVATLGQHHADTTVIFVDRAKAMIGVKERLGEIGIKVGICGAGDHVGRVENRIKTIKEKLRTLINRLPFELPEALMSDAVTYVVKRLNCETHGASPGYRCPRVALTGTKIDFKREYCAGFGDYVEARDPAAKSNSVDSPRTNSCIALWPVGNREGSWSLYTLGTGQHVVRSQFRVIPTPQVVVDRLNQLCNEERTKSSRRDGPAHETDTATTVADTVVQAVEMTPEAGLHDDEIEGPTATQGGSA